MLSLGALDLRSKTNILLWRGGVPYFQMGSVAFGLENPPTILNYKSRYQCFFKSSWKQFKLVKKTCKALDLKKKSAACFVFATTTWSREVGVAYLPGRATPMFPRQLLKAIIVMHVNELKSFKKSKSMIKRKTWMRKKKFRVNVQDRSLKKQNKQLRQKTKNSLLIRAIQKVIAVF